MNKKTLGALATAIASLSTAPLAELCAVEPPPPRFLRFEEDNRYLRDPACRTDAWEDFKYIALDDTGTRFITIGGDIRVSFQNSRDVPYGEDAVQGGGNQVNDTAQRYHVHADFQAASWLRLFGELKSNRVAGRDPIASINVDENRIDTHQLFVDFSSDGATLRLGRQELVYGSGRRIFSRNGPNVRGSYDAIRLMAQRGVWRADAFAFRAVEPQQGAFDDGTIDNETFYGIYLAGDPAIVWPFGLDLYWIQSRRKPLVAAGVLDDRHTVGARLAGVRGRWDFDGEASYQVGQNQSGPTSRNIRAWAITGEGGYTIPAWRLTRFSLRLSVGSGDRDPVDGKVQTFYSILPAGNTLDDYFGLSSANLVFARPSVQVQWTPRFRTRFDAIWTRRLSDRDGIYASGGARVPLVGEANSRALPVGREVGVLGSYLFSRRLSFGLKAGFFHPEAFLLEVKPAKVDAWVLHFGFHYRF